MYGLVRFISMVKFIISIFCNFYLKWIKDIKGLKTSWNACLNNVVIEKTEGVCRKEKMFGWP